MKKFVLGSLITFAAASTGAMAGAVLALVLCIPLFIIAYFDPNQYLSNSGYGMAVNGLIIVLPVVGAVTGIWLGWNLVLTAPGPEEEKRRCQQCGYDLIATASGQCPECGTMIPYWQQRWLMKLNTPDA